MSIEACAGIVERGDPDRYLATMTAPVAARAVLLPIYAFNIEVTRAAWASQEPMVGEMRLQWWYDVLGEIAEGKPVRAHEVVAPLVEVIGAQSVPIEVLKALVEARRWDIYRDPFEDRVEFDSYIDRTAAGLMWAAACALGAPAETEGQVRDHGWSAGLASFLRAIPDLEGRGRRPLVDGTPDAVTELAREGLERAGRARKTPLPREIHPALRTGWRARRTLERAASEPGAVAAGVLDESEFSRRSKLFRLSVMGGW